MKTLKTILDRVDKVFETLEKYVTAIALIIFTVVLFCNVVGRYILGSSITWAEELSRYLNIFLVYFALSAGIKHDSHIGVDAVETLLVPKRFHKYMDMFRFAVTLFFCVISGYMGAQLVAVIARIGWSSAAMQLPMFIPYLALPIGLFMASIRCVIRIIDLIITPDEDTNEDKEAMGA